MTEQSEQEYTKDTEQNTGARMAEVDSDPQRSLEETKNAAAGEGPTGAGGSVPNTVDEHVPSTSDPEATDLPTAR